MKKSSRFIILILLGCVFLIFLFIAIGSYDRLTVVNQSQQPISKMVVVFYGNLENKRVIFENVASGGSQWQPFDQQWGWRDSSRIIGVEGTTADGKEISASPQYIMQYIGTGERFIVAVHPNRSVTLHCCNSTPQSPN